MKVDIGWLHEQFPMLRDIAPLSGGGQKLVFSAIHSDADATVLKLVHPSQPEQLVTRELLAVDTVRSKRIPSIVEAGTIQTQIGTCFWIIEERIPGATLRERLAVSTLSPIELYRLALHMLEALVDAEAVNIVHRDVKPDNIIIDPQGACWLLDFGIARHLSLTALTSVDARWGKFTPGYAPPEQFRNIQHEIDSRADLFGLGITIYEAAVGTNPFRYGAADDLEVLRRVEGQVLPRVPVCFGSHFSDFVASLSQRRREHRPRSSREALEWLQEIPEPA